MGRAAWGRRISGRCCGVRESSSQPLTPKGTAPLLHCPDPRKARATFHGACPRQPQMAMPVARYTGAGTGRPAAADTRRRPSRITESPPAGWPPHRITAPSRGAARRPHPPARPTAPVTTTVRSANGVVRRVVFSRLPEPAVLVAYGTSAGDAGALAPGLVGRHRRLPHPAPPVRTRGRPPDRGGAREQSHGEGRAPVERLNPAYATVYFQPTSRPCRFLGELADQPPCHQARRDHAVRFHLIGTGHEREAHFPARPGGGTLRDRMLPATWPCRYSAGWSTCHDGTTGRSRFDLGCRRLGTRARPRGNVQERQARKDQEDANTEGGLAS